MLGLPLIVIGALLSITIVGAVVGIPLLLAGLLLFTSITGWFVGVVAVLTGIAFLVLDVLRQGGRDATRGRRRALERENRQRVEPR